MAKVKRSKKYGYMRCHACGKKIRYKLSPKYVKRDGLDPNRLIAIRRHYKEHHPVLWKKIIARGARKRAKNR